MIPRFPISITLANGETFTGKVMFDSGNAATLLVSTPYSKFHDFDSKLGETTLVGGRGLSASTIDRLAVIKSMNFNQFNFGPMMIKLTVNDQAKPAEGYLGILGIDVIKRFNLILDYAHKKIYMKPNQNYSDKFDLDFFNSKITDVRESQVFLQKNATAPGVKVTASGLQYQVIKQGTGPIPAANDKVVIYYTAKLLNGKVIAGPFSAAHPFEHHLDKALDGIREGVLMMPVGSVYKLFIPASLGFGEAGYMDVPPGAMLICDVELVKID
jgi:FKBP-type peptidyl-prolyl cis-trans isomerase